MEMKQEKASEIKPTVFMNFFAIDLQNEWNKDKERRTEPKAKALIYSCTYCL